MVIFKLNKLLEKENIGQRELSERNWYKTSNNKRLC